MPVTVKPAILLILDGWGFSKQQEFNAIYAANTPIWDRLWRDYPHGLIGTSGAAVGLPNGQMGNSEVGHINLGAGRVVYQAFTRISQAIATGTFFTNAILMAAVDKVVVAGKAIHLFGLLSPGGVHSHEKHIHAMAKLAVARGARQVYLHAFLDGRDTPPRSAQVSLEAMEQLFKQLGHGRIASVVGRFYAMDRDNRWDRVQKIYDMLTLGESEYRATGAASGLEMAYARGEGDEFVSATAIVPAGESPVRILDGDAVFFMNYRPDRARELTRCFIEPAFDGFKRRWRPQLSSYVSLTQYSKDFPIPVAFPARHLDNVFGEYIAQRGLRQLRIAETEKYAHVTFFFNGGREEAFEGEDRILVPSPQVETYDLKPEMSAPEVTKRLVAAIESGGYDAIICNYANSDMVGHTGHFEAAVKAIEALDACLGRVVSAAQGAGVELLITADHGNAEQMSDKTSGQPHTAHTQNPVPLIYIGRPARLREGGALCDIAPTLLQMMGLGVPDQMQGHSLVDFLPDRAGGT